MTWLVSYVLPEPGLPVSRKRELAGLGLELGSGRRGGREAGRAGSIVGFPERSGG